MAHFAELNNHNNVIRIVVVDNEILLENNVENEQKGIQYLTNLLGGRWIQSSYNAQFRKNAAFPGCTYNIELDAFIVPQPYPSWVLDENAKWQPPIAMPLDGESYGWDEVSKTWIQTSKD